MVMSSTDTQTVHMHYMARGGRDGRQKIEAFTLREALDEFSKGCGSFGPAKWLYVIAIENEDARYEPGEIVAELRDIADMVERMDGPR